MATTFTYTPTDPGDAYKPTVVYGISFPPGQAVTVKQEDLSGDLTVEQVEAKLTGNPEFTKAGEDKEAIATAKRRAKEAKAAEDLRAETAAAHAAALQAGPTA
jgi:hypothetical protein